MGLASQVATISLILLFALDVFTDVATGVELILNDKPFCEFFCNILGCFGDYFDYGELILNEKLFCELLLDVG